MKKLGLLSCFCTMLFAQASTQNSLEQAIRSLDVKTVDQMVKGVSVTTREYNCYVLLAEEMVRSREIWVLKDNYYNDVTTPFEVPSNLRMTLGCLSAFLGFYTTIISTVIFLNPGNDRELALIGGVFGAALVGRYIYDVRKCFTADLKLKECLRNKYEDAVTIRQLVCALEIVAA